MKHQTRGTGWPSAVIQGIYGLQALRCQLDGIFSKALAARGHGMISFFLVISTQLQKQSLGLKEYLRVESLMLYAWCAKVRGRRRPPLSA